MNEPLTLALAFVAGAGLGMIFFAGLWWTVRKGISSPRPALWFLGSGLLRMSVVLAGFYFVSGGQFRRLVACLVGFIVMRLVVLWLTRPARENQKPPMQEVRHAP